MKRINFGALLFNLVMALFIGGAAQAIGLNFYAASGTVFTLGMVMPKELKQSLGMAIQVEVWQSDIVASLFKKNPFINYAFNADQYVVGGKIVHIPTAGAAPTVVKNRSSLPATIAKRTDVDILYQIDEFTTDPILIPDADTVELSYDKRQSVTGEHFDALVAAAGDWMLYNWFTGLNAAADAQVTGTILRTTGGNVAAHMPSSTGLRLKFLKEDLKRARTTMNKANIPNENRYAIFSSDLLDQLMDDADLIKRDGAQGGELNLGEGVIMRLYGFNIMERATTLTFTNAATPLIVAPGTAGAAAHNDAVLCWQSNAVEKALGDVKFFDDMGNPAYYGDIYSALLRVGGRARRAAGVVAIVQAHGA